MTINEISTNIGNDRNYIRITNTSNSTFEKNYKRYFNEAKQQKKIITPVHLSFPLSVIFPF